MFLIGMGILSWQGRYCSSGPAGTGSNCPARNHIPFWWDIGAVAAFALVIFYCAQAVRLPKEEMELLVERQAGGQTEAKPLGEAT